MTKADIVNEITKNTGIDKTTVLTTVEAFMDAVKASLSKDENVYLRGFGSFVVKKRAQKTARNISKNITIIISEMTKADIVNEITKKTGADKQAVLNTLEAFMDTVKESLSREENVYLRGFGSFIVKKRAQKTARNISKNTTIIIPEHNIPAFKPAKTFTISVKK